MNNASAVENLHERARRLIDQERVEGLAPEDRRWLEEHLAGCEACSGWAASAEAAIRALKSVSVAVPPGLAVRAQSLYAALALGAVPGLTSPLAGRLYQAMGGTAFFAMAAASLAAAACGWMLGRRWQGGPVV